MLQAALKVEGGCNQQWMLDRAHDIVASSAEKLLAVDLSEGQVGSFSSFGLCQGHLRPECQGNSGPELQGMHDLAQVPQSEHLDQDRVIAIPLLRCAWVLPCVRHVQVCNKGYHFPC